MDKDTNTGTKIKELRKQLGITQAQLAKAVGISSNYMTQIETGKRKGVFVIAKIAQALGVNAEVLEGKKPAPPSLQTKPIKASLEALEKIVTACIPIYVGPQELSHVANTTVPTGYFMTGFSTTISPSVRAYRVNFEDNHPEDIQDDYREPIEENDREPADGGIQEFIENNEQDYNREQFEPHRITSLGFRFEDDTDNLKKAETIIVDTALSPKKGDIIVITTTNLIDGVNYSNPCPSVLRYHGTQSLKTGKDGTTKSFHAVVIGAYYKLK
ncbi:MAG: helix-turn-helix domain-containing protein [Dehalococcoidia bacterium]|nr:helix-turn-helix domain-containing protein [Dehalococcoidia bacterium]